MSEELTTDTLVAGENVHPVGTDTETETVVEAKSEQSVKPSTPNVENKDGKLFVDGVRVYSRDETNAIASKAKKDVEAGLLSDLDVDSFDQVKQVVTQLRNTDVEQGHGLNVNALKDAVKKREQTVDELRSELSRVKTDYALKEHIGALKDNMPSQWNIEQKSAVVDLMKARDMLHLEGDTFAIKQGEDYFTTDGESPDYKTAVEVVGKGLGLPFAKKGVDTFDVDRQPNESKASGLASQDKMKSDPAYRQAYINLRDRNRNLSRSEITDAMVQKQMKNSTSGSLQDKFLR
jgi:hypothetical protein